MLSKFINLGETNFNLTFNFPSKGLVVGFKKNKKFKKIIKIKKRRENRVWTGWHWAWSLADVETNSFQTLDSKMNSGPEWLESGYERVDFGSEH